MNKRLIVIAVIILAVLGVGGGSFVYFYRCATTNPLFSNVRSGARIYSYRLSDRLNFCWNFIFQPKAPKEPDRSQAVAIMGPKRAFLTEPRSEHPPYNSNPPTSGWNSIIPPDTHWYLKNYSGVTYYRVGRRDAPTEMLVAKLYGGSVWIAFKRIPQEQDFYKYVSKDSVEKLKEIAASTPLVFVAPHSSLDTDIAVAALGRLDKWNLQNRELRQEDIDRIWDFILRYRNQPGTR